jgi:death on curing protein
MADFAFLSLEQVYEIHRAQLKTHGGADGVIDPSVIDSATNSPKAMTLFGQEPDAADLAGAYLYHFAASQGFRDGNKRTALVCCSTFLRVNGYRLACTDEELYGATIDVAERRMGKEEAADWIRERVEPLP